MFPPDLSPELREAYQATAYEVFVEEVPWVLTLGEGAPAPFDVWLRGQRVSTWAFVTAWNPGSHLVSSVANASRQQALVREVEAAGLGWIPGRGRPLVPGWTPEESLLVLGISSEDAARLGAQFGQLAVVVGGPGENCRLLVC